ncbi:MAG: hypothetical protein CMO80_22065 [Verrucomicrobiales bacterium]|nr:hypothetical protein [Verrucomicrobiales bacterium]|tara:strand:- start:14240 stop:14668 length:429 start_codon:yes stop_codon:yes gene_type:complete
MSAFNENLTLDQKILEWAGNSEALARLKKVEMAQRQELAKELFPDPKYGTQHHQLGGGYKVTLVHKQDTKLDEDAFALIQPELEKLGDDAKAELTNAVKYKASLVMAGYKNMSDTVKELFDEAVVTKDASPSLKLVVPKEDK